MTLCPLIPEKDSRYYFSQSWSHSVKRRRAWEVTVRCCHSQLISSNESLGLIKYSRGEVLFQSNLHCMSQYNYWNTYWLWTADACSGYMQFSFWFMTLVYFALVRQSDYSECWMSVLYKFTRTKLTKMCIFCSTFCSLGSTGENRVLFVIICTFWRYLKVFVSSLVYLYFIVVSSV